ncbi:Mu transposase C-terminal domain-containing protein [Streptomyces coeruleorubidus]
MDIPAADLWTFTLEDDGRARKLTSHGVRWRGRTYIAPWMTGQAGRTVTVRYMPHHDHEIDICDARGGYPGPAHPADAANPGQLDALRTARAERARRLCAEVKAAETLRRQRFAPATTAGPDAVRPGSPHRRSSRGRTGRRRAHRRLGSGAAGPHPARRAPGRLAYPALSRHPDHAGPPRSAPARTRSAPARTRSRRPARTGRRPR